MDVLLNKISAIVARARQLGHTAGRADEKHCSIRELQLCKRQLERMKTSQCAELLIEDLLHQLSEMVTALQRSIASRPNHTSSFQARTVSISFISIHGTLIE